MRTVRPIHPFEAHGVPEGAAEIVRGAQVQIRRELEGLLDQCAGERAAELVAELESWQSQEIDR